MKTWLGLRCWEKFWDAIASFIWEGLRMGKSNTGTIVTTLTVVSYLFVNFIFVSALSYIRGEEFTD